MRTEKEIQAAHDLLVAVINSLPFDCEDVHSLFCSLRDTLEWVMDTNPKATKKVEQNLRGLRRICKKAGVKFERPNEGTVCE